MPKNPDNPKPEQGPQWKNPDRECSTCGQSRPNPGQCTARNKQTKRRCENDCVLGYKVCRLHGAKGGRPPTNYRYTRAIQKSPEMKAAYQEIMAAGGGNEYDLTDEIVLARVRLNAAITSGDVDLKAEQDMLNDLLRAVQKNQDLRIKEQGLVARSDAEKVLRAAVKALVPYIPDSLRAKAFEEIAAILTRGGRVLQAEQVIDAEGHEVVEEEEIEARRALPDPAEKRRRGVLSHLEAEAEDDG
jgi:hypothetical protein